MKKRTVPAARIRAFIAAHPKEGDDYVAARLGCAPSAVARVRARSAVRGRPPIEGTGYVVHLDMLTEARVRRRAGCTGEMMDATLLELVKRGLDT